MDFKLENIPEVVATCLVLHNVCKTFGDNIREEWASDNSFHGTLSSSSGHGTTTNSRAAVIRDSIKDYLCSR